MNKFAIALLAALACLSASAADHKLSSPDGSLVAVVSTDNGISYSLTQDGILLLEPTEISMTLSDGSVYGAKARLQKTSRRSVNSVIPATVYFKSSVEDCYNELTLKYSAFSVVFRAYNDGFAYRFVSHSKKDFTVKSEQGGYALPAGTQIYVPYVAQHLETLESQLFNSFENRYEHIAVENWDKSRLAFLPLLAEAEGGRKLCFMEADVFGYPGMFLHNSDADSRLEPVFAQYPAGQKAGGHHFLQQIVTSREDYIARASKGAAFPWRIVMVSRSDAQLACNDMVFRLSEAADPKADFSWVKPGKVAWDWWNDWNISGVDFKSGVNTETYKYYIDFAGRNGIEYVILDEGWAVNNAADLFQVVPEIDLEEIISFAAERNVGIILWAGYWAFARDMEHVCEHYSKMGVKGFKIDFMDRDDQIITDFHRRAAQICAKYHLMADFHGTYKPTGLHRTYPNVVNYEGVHGLEQMKWSKPKVDQVTYDVTVPYIRMAAGPMDYTQGAMRNASMGNYYPCNSEPMSQGTRCHQLGEYVIFNSPLNMLCDSPSNYMAEPECTAYIASVPTVWDETVPVAGKVGEYIVLARRSGDTWYIGGLNNWDARDVEIDLEALGLAGRSCVIFQDGANAERKGTDYKRAECRAESTLKIHMAPGGGFSVKF